MSSRVSHRSSSHTPVSQGDAQSISHHMTSLSLSGDTLLPSTLTSSHSWRSVRSHGSSRSSTASSARSTSSSTTQQLRIVEQERDNLRRAHQREEARMSEMQRMAKEQQAIIERLKREGSTSILSATDAEQRMQQIECDMQVAKAEKSPPTKGTFKAAYSTDLLFLIDTTGSMSPYIDAVKQQVVDIVDDIKEAFLNEADVRIAVVSYKDHGDDGHRDYLDFTTSPEKVRKYVSRLDASGGGDRPEDVLGGLKTSLGLSWRQQTKCIIHIADAPPHGYALNTYDHESDDYLTPGSEPHGLTYKPLLRKMIAKEINYAFLRINRSTDLMAFKFSKIYAAAAADASLSKRNKHYTEACLTHVSSSALPHGTVKGGLLFAEMKLGTSYSALRQLVVSTVTSSASCTALRVSLARPSTLGGHRTDRSRLSTVGEEGPTQEMMLDTAPSQWSTRGWLDEKLTVQGFLPYTMVHDASTLDAMMAEDHSIPMTVSELTVKKRSYPFAEGVLRRAYYARTAHSVNKFVVKSLKRNRKRLADLVDDMRCQALCKAFALEFNSILEEDQAIDFVATTCFKPKSAWEDASEDGCMSLEPYLPGDYVKYNTNAGWVNKDLAGDRLNNIAQAFSHFTFERSEGRFLVCDLQGVGSMLTDPCIHTRDPERFKLTGTNKGPDGFKFFFSTHECNEICTMLELESTKVMLREDGILEFRSDWPLVTTTWCCANRLCGRIIPTSGVHSSTSWCTDCEPQLGSFTKKWLCVHERGNHEFDVSTFYYESQGCKAPRNCAEHRNESGVPDRYGTHLDDYGVNAGVYSSSLSHGHPRNGR